MYSRLALDLALLAFGTICAGAGLVWTLLGPSTLSLGLTALGILAFGAARLPGKTPRPPEAP